MIDYEDTFESADSGASLTFPSTAGDVKLGGYMCIEKRPCKIVDYDTHKTGKHGSAKCSIVGIDIFTDKKMVESLPADTHIEIPIITRREFSVFSIDEQGYCSLLDVITNEMRNDIRLPDLTDVDEDLSKKLSAEILAGKDVNVTVMSAMNMEKIIDFKEI